MLPNPLQVAFNYDMLTDQFSVLLPAEVGPHKFTAFLAQHGITCEEVDNSVVAGWRQSREDVRLLETLFRAGRARFGLSMEIDPHSHQLITALLAMLQAPESL